jgi:hypothetical protein
VSFAASPVGGAVSMQYNFLIVHFFGCIPGKINCSKGSKSKEYKRKKCLDFWVAPSIESQGLTCRSGHYGLFIEFIGMSV